MPSKERLIPSKGENRKLSVFVFILNRNGHTPRWCRKEMRVEIRSVGFDKSFKMNVALLRDYGTVILTVDSNMINISTVLGVWILEAAEQTNFYVPARSLARWKYLVFFLKDKDFYQGTKELQNGREHPNGQF